MKRRKQSKQSPADFARRLLRWYDRNQRALPWRVLDSIGGERPDPYAVLVSEFMLQQTQVATVIPYFQRFLAKFPTFALLAAADEQEVLRLWQGLGYYSRARNLLAAARKIVGDFQGFVPNCPQQLQTLPGIGRYTAGAIASIAHGVSVPVVDGNVARVICRLDLIKTDPRDRKTIQQLWNRAGQLLPSKRPGDFNSAMMELGATVCTPRSPKCLICPVNKHCRAFAAGLQESIPPARKSKPLPLEKRWTLCISHRKRWLIEQRPPRGRWAGLWQFVTLPPNGRANSAGFSKHLGFKITQLKSLGEIEHILTHRRYIFEVFSTDAKIKESDIANQTNGNRRWVLPEELQLYPLPKPHLKIAEMLSTN